ncbi:MAG TPA: hypothetical protein VLE96_05450 [Chlamydiales bacterium]|nr:hypothetical protein [Chlamydiales bacterium]
MTDEELLEHNRAGFIPGPQESEEKYLRRIESTKAAYLKLGVAAIPSSHWEWVEKKILDGFDFVPRCLPAFYSNRSLAPWQGAAAWVERDQILAIQLREAFKKGTFLKIYSRSEILAHEAVHAARSAFPVDPWDEYFAYMTSEKVWRRALGPIVRRPWEVWPLLAAFIVGPFLPLSFLFASVWIGLGFIRLIRGHFILKKASLALQKKGLSNDQVRHILFRLTNVEIQKLAKGKDLSEEQTLRWQLLNIYLRNK